MKLYIGNSFWLDTVVEKENYERLNSDIETEVLVLGGGMSGMLSAFRSSEYNKTVLIDENLVGQGSSCLNTGLIQYMSDDMLFEMEEKHGKKIAQSFYKDSVRALDNIEEIVSKLDENPDFLRNASIIIASEKEDIKDLEKENIALKKIGLKTTLLSKDELKEKGLNGHGGFITYNDVELNPYKFVSFMGKYAVKNFNLKIFENTSCERIDFDKDEVLTKSGFKIRYKKLIIATGYNFLDEVKGFIPEAKLIKTFASITEPMEMGSVNKDDYMVWETASPYFYYRKSIKGNIVMGGEDKEDLNFDYDELDREEEKLRKKFEENRGIKPKDTPWKYAAIFGESESGLPYIGPHPNFDNVLIVHGVGGNGTVYSSIASMYVNDFIRDGVTGLKNIEYLFPSKRRRNNK